MFYIVYIVHISYVFITSKMAMLISHIFETNHSEILGQIERLPILAGDLTMAAFALKSYPWLSFLYVFERTMETDLCCIIVNLKFLTHLLPTYPFFTWKRLYGFLMLPGVGGKGRVPCKWFKILDQLRCK